MADRPVSGPAFGRLLRDHRAAAGLTQEQLAERSGLAVRTIRNLEAGQVGRPHGQTITLLAAALGLPPAARAELTRAGGHSPGQPAPGGHAGAGGAGYPPRQLPPAIPHFAGRVAELKLLTDLIGDAADPGGTVVISAIGGTAGIGKTALAVHWAHQVADRFPDGQLYVDLRGFDPGGQPLAAAEAVYGFLAALGVPLPQIPAGLEARTARYRSLLAGKRMLVVLDNARDAAHVRPLLPGSPGCLALITSRTQLLSLVATEGAHPLTLELLTVAEARELLARRLGITRVSREQQAADELIGLCARLPLALNIVAARAASDPARPLAELAGQLRETHHRLDALDAGDPAADVRSVFSWSCRQLSGQAARMFRLLGEVHPGPDISVAAAASLAGVPPRQARRALAELTAARLVTERPSGRFHFHDLLRAYAREGAQVLDSDPERRAALRRVLDHYLHTACRAARLLSPARDPVTLAAPQPGTAPAELTGEAQALAWLEAEYPVLLAAVAVAAGPGLETYAWQLPWALADFLARRGHWQAYVTTQETALAAAQRLGDLHAQARAHGELGYAHGMLGSYREAGSHLEHALRLYRQFGDTASQAITTVSLAHLQIWQQRYDKARERARQALALAQAAGHRHAQASALNTIGWCNASLGEHQQALADCQQALTILRGTGDRFGEAATLDSLGYVHRQIGDYQRALGCYRDACQIFTDLKDRFKQSEALTGLGDTHHAGGNEAAARACWQQALGILTELGHPDADTVRARLGQQP